MANGISSFLTNKIFPGDAPNNQTENSNLKTLLFSPTTRGEANTALNHITEQFVTRQTSTSQTTAAKRAGDETQKTVNDFLNEVLRQQPVAVNDQNADKVRLTMKVGKPSQETTREDYNLAFRRAVYNKAMDGLELTNEEIKQADKALIEAKLYQSYFNLQGSLDGLKANQQKSGNEMPIAVGRQNIEYARRAGQAILQHREYKAKQADAKQEGNQSKTNQMLLDPLRLGGNVPVRWTERILNTPRDLVQQIDRGEIMPGSSTAKWIGGKISEQITGEPAPQMLTISESVENLTGAKLPSIPEIEVPRPFEYQTEKYKHEGNIGEDLGATAIDLFLLKRGITNSRINSPQSLKDLGGIPEIEAVNSVSNTSKATVDIRKFSEYIFTPKSGGKDVVFKKLGYSQKDSAKLAEIWQEQASEKFARGEYDLGIKDKWGQRIDIEIKLEGVGESTGKVSRMKSGWMLNNDGTISLNTPFSGFTK